MYFNVEAGFDGVEIHATNGYLIDQFLQSSSNKRTDKYGGGFENRYLFLKEVVEACLSVYPAGRIGVRLSMNGTFGGMGAADNYDMFMFTASKLSEYNLAYLHMCDGTDFGFHGLCKQIKLVDAKIAFKGPVMGNMGYTRDSADGAIRSGAADLVAFGRLFITNPDLVER
jgi:N-ethylmaleimide reductase